MNSKFQIISNNDATEIYGGITWIGLAAGTAIVAGVVVLGAMVMGAINGAQDASSDCEDYCNGGG